MNSVGIVVLIVTLLSATGAPASAQEPVYVDPLGALLLFPFAVAATITGGVAALLAAPFTYPDAYQAAYDYPYAYSPAYAYPYPYGSSYAYGAPAYVYAPAPAPSYWYYCASARTYHPYVSTCPEGWMQVVPRTP